MEADKETFDLEAKLRGLQEAARSLASISREEKHRLLLSLAAKIVKNKPAILAANKLDCEQIAPTESYYDRLLLTEQRLDTMAKGLQSLLELPEVLNKFTEERVRPNGLHISKLRVAIGVILIIYEARPNLSIDLFALAFLSGNAVLLKGGTEARQSNAILVKLIQECLIEQQVNPGLVLLVPPSRELLLKLLQQKKFIDLCIPRGSAELINFVNENAKMAVIETGAGVVHCYVDSSADLAMAGRIIANAKLRRPSVCNSLDILLVHKDLEAEIALLLHPLQNSAVELYLEDEIRRHLRGYPQNLLHKLSEAELRTEFLSLKMAVKLVDDVEHAIEHINSHGSKHSEAIISASLAKQNLFINGVDAANILINSSSSFVDGEEFGIGLELGISTQKIHARGPMGLEALTTYKWIVKGQGQVREQS